MDSHYLLYIDILGFEDLVENAPDKVEELFNIAASLHAHSHYAFSTISFSDTILVNNVVPSKTTHDHNYSVMYMCEFFKDLQLRLSGRDISLRAILTYGAFRHYRLNGVPTFYGPALNLAYRTEKKRELTGLLMDDHCAHYSDIFSLRSLQDGWNYVFVTQALDTWEDHYGAMRPLPDVIMLGEEFGWTLGPELEVLAQSVRQSTTHSDARVRHKHAETLEMYKWRYPHVWETMRPHDFAMEEASPHCDWGAVRKRMAESFSWAAKRTLAKSGEETRREQTND